MSQKFIGDAIGLFRKRLTSITAVKGGHGEH